jgi:hypothetical protein
MVQYKHPILPEFNIGNNPESAKTTHNPTHKWLNRNVGAIGTIMVCPFFQNGMNFSGPVNLSLPLGIQSLIGFVSGGQLVTSVTVLITFIIIGVLVGGSR